MEEYFLILGINMKIITRNDFIDIEGGMPTKIINLTYPQLYTKIKKLKLKLVLLDGINHTDKIDGNFQMDELLKSLINEINCRNYLVIMNSRTQKVNKK